MKNLQKLETMLANNSWKQIHESGVYSHNVGSGVVVYDYQGSCLIAIDFVDQKLKRLDSLDIEIEATPIDTIISTVETFLETSKTLMSSESDSGYFELPKSTLETYPHWLDFSRIKSNQLSLEN